MSIKKAKIENTIYDVVTMEEYKRNRHAYEKYPQAIAIEIGDNNDTVIYPVRGQTDSRPGYYPNGAFDNKEPFFIHPRTDDERLVYSGENCINFSNARNLRDIIEAQDKLNKAERSILTTVDNITVPIISETDTPFMKAIKTAIELKRVDMDKYAHRFGSNYPNDKRLLKKPDMTLQKGIAYAECLDFDIYVTIKDKEEDVPNPIGQTIVAKLTGDGAGFTEDLDDEMDLIDQATGSPTVTAAMPNSSFQFIEYTSPVQEEAHDGLIFF